MLLKHRYLPPSAEEDGGRRNWNCYNWRKRQEEGQNNKESRREEDGRAGEMRTEE